MKEIFEAAYYGRSKNTPSQHRDRQWYTSIKVRTEACAVITLEPASFYFQNRSQIFARNDLERRALGCTGRQAVIAADPFPFPSPHLRL